MEERMAKLEVTIYEMREMIGEVKGIVSELSKRVDDLRSDTDHKFSLVLWEVTIWFMILMLVVSIWSYLILNIV